NVELREAAPGLPHLGGLNLREPFPLVCRPIHADLMADTSPPLPRRMTLAHQPFYGVLDLKSGENLTLQEFIGEGDYGDLIVKRRLNLEHDLIEGNVRYVCQRCHGPMVLRSIAAGKEREDRF